MTVISLKGRERTQTHTSPRRRNSAEQRRPGVNVVDSPAITVSFEVTLAGESRYSDALGILETLREVTDRLGTATVDIGPALTGDAGIAVATPRGLFGATPSAGIATDDGSIQVLADSRMVVAMGEEVTLTRMEFELLLFLTEHPRRVFSRAHLLRSVWDYKRTQETASGRTVDVHVRRLRAKFSEALIDTVRGVGYRLGQEASVRLVRLE